MNRTPVILVCYNRPDHTAKVLDSLRAHGVSNLIIFSDAPKTPADRRAVRKTRKLIEKISWTEPDVVYQEVNQGLAASIVAAADHALEKHDSFILLEDDCVPQRYFFDFMYQCLERYKDNERVFGINGYTVPVPAALRESYPYDIYFYPRIGSWGWATWKRAWKHYDRDLLKLYNTARERDIDLTRGGADIPLSVERYLAGEIMDVWTLNWVLATYLHDACYIYPTVSHIENIGCDGSGVHCGKTAAFRTELAQRPSTRFPAHVFFEESVVANYNGFFGAPAEKGNAADAGERKLNVVHLNTHDSVGGAAKVAWRLNEWQRAAGHDARLLVGIKKLAYPFSETFEPDPDLYQLRRCRSEGLLDYELLGSLALVRHPLVRGADLLHLHNLHGGYFNPFALPGLSKVKPIVWTLHDMHPITGHCAHSFQCERWKTGCGECPGLHIPPALEVDSTARLWSDKKGIYAASTLSIVTPSRWLKEKVEKSILGAHPVEVIRNGVDTSIFSPRERAQVRSRYGIPGDAFVIGSAAHGGAASNAWKGGDDLMAVLGGVWERCPETYFLNIGGEVASDDRRMVGTGHVGDEAVMAELLACLDCFVYTPVADNCPLVVLEALAAAVPVVTFAVGGIPELVRDGIDGCVVKGRNVGVMVEAVAALKEGADTRERFSRAARESAVSTFDLKRVADEYEALYLKVLENDMRRDRCVHDAASVPYYRLGEKIEVNPLRYLVTSLLRHEGTFADSLHDSAAYFRRWAREQKK